MEGNIPKKNQKKIVTLPKKKPIGNSIKNQRKIEYRWALVDIPKSLEFGLIFFNPLNNSLETFIPKPKPIPLIKEFENLPIIKFYLIGIEKL